MCFSWFWLRRMRSAVDSTQVNFLEIFPSLILFPERISLRDIKTRNPVLISRLDRWR